MPMASRNNQNESISAIPLSLTFRQPLSRTHCAYLHHYNMSVWLGIAQAAYMGTESQIGDGLITTSPFWAKRDALSGIGIVCNKEDLILTYHADYSRLQETVQRHYHGRMAVQKDDKGLESALEGFDVAFIQQGCEIPDERILHMERTSCEHLAFDIYSDIFSDSPIAAERHVPYHVRIQETPWNWAAYGYFGIQNTTPKTTHIKTNEVPEYMICKRLEIGSVLYLEPDPEVDNRVMYMGGIMNIYIMLSAPELDDRGWVADFGSFGNLRDVLKDITDHRILVHNDAWNEGAGRFADIAQCRKYHIWYATVKNIVEKKCQLHIDKYGPASVNFAWDIT